jgi:myotubularin-related protein 3/4
MSEEQLKKIASFRSSHRFPAVVWRSKSNGAVLARSSQPNVGLLGWRLNEDELLVKAIADSSCLGNSIKAKMIESMADQTSDSKSVSIAANSSEAQLLIIDARCRSVALANRVKGGGYEYAEYYSNSEIQFMNLENIHVIRNSFHALRALCQSVNDNKT